MIVILLLDLRCLRRRRKLWWLPRSLALLPSSSSSSSMSPSLPRPITSPPRVAVTAVAALSNIAMIHRHHPICPSIISSPSQSSIDGLRGREERRRRRRVRRRRGWTKTTTCGCCGGGGGGGDIVVHGCRGRAQQEIGQLNHCLFISVMLSLTSPFAPPPAPPSNS